MFSITYRSQKTEVPKQAQFYPPFDLNTNFIRGDIKIVFSGDLILIFLVESLQLKLVGGKEELKISEMSLLREDGGTKIFILARGVILLGRRGLRKFEVKIKTA